jgi:hypothetical protein
MYRVSHVPALPPLALAWSRPRAAGVMNGAINACPPLSRRHGLTELPPQGCRPLRAQVSRLSTSQACKWEPTVSAGGGRCSEDGGRRQRATPGGFGRGEEEGPEGQIVSGGPGRRPVCLQRVFGVSPCVARRGLPVICHPVAPAMAGRSDACATAAGCAVPGRARAGALTPMKGGQVASSVLSGKARSTRWSIGGQWPRGSWVTATGPKQPGAPVPNRERTNGEGEGSG